MHKKMSFRSSALVWHGDPQKRRRLPHQHARWFAMTLIYGNFYFSRQVLVSAPVAEQHLFICKPVPGQIQNHIPGALLLEAVARSGDDHQLG